METHFVRLLPGKRNRVELRALPDGEKYVVRKSFSKPKALQRETEVYGILKRHGLRVPDILKIEEDSVWYEYVPGENFVEILEEQELRGYAESEPWLKLCRWLAGFYGATNSETGFIMRDMHLRNFILRTDNSTHSGEVYGLDFECCSAGKFEDDIIQLLASILTYDPPYTMVKEKICDIVLNALRGSFESEALNLKESVVSAAISIQNRRKRRSTGIKQ